MQERIDEISLPQLDNNFILVSTRDYPRNQSDTGYSTVQYLLLTSSSISYYRQPVLALSATTANRSSSNPGDQHLLPSCREANMSKNPSLNPPRIPIATETLKSAIAEPGLETLERTYRFSGSRLPEQYPHPESMWKMEEDILHIYTPTQWPSHVKRDGQWIPPAYPNARSSSIGCPFTHPTMRCCSPRLGSHPCIHCLHQGTVSGGTVVPHRKLTTRTDHQAQKLVSP